VFSILLLKEIGAFLFGAVIGSFANACIYRWPRELSIVSPRSMCTRCGTQVAAYDNIPVLSYLLLRGKCRNCKTPYGFQYFWVEVLVGLVAWYLAHTRGTTFGSVYLFFLVTSLLVVSLIDLEHRIIPDEISIGGTAIGIVVAAITTWLGVEWMVTFKQALLGASVGYGMLWVTGWVYEKITGREGIGLGDVKLMAFFGAHGGFLAVFSSLFYGSLIGFVIGISWIIIHKKGRRTPIPFGPFLSIGFLIYLAFGYKSVEILLELVASSKIF